MEMRKIDIPGKRNKDGEREKTPHACIDGGIDLIFLGCQVVREEGGNTIF